jgi:hypothetical protein
MLTSIVSDLLLGPLPWYVFFLLKINLFAYLDLVGCRKMCHLQSSSSGASLIMDWEQGWFHHST